MKVSTQIFVAFFFFFLGMNSHAQKGEVLKSELNHYPKNELLPAEKDNILETKSDSLLTDINSY